VKLSLDLHPLYNKGDEIEKALDALLTEAARIKAASAEIIPGKGSGQLKKRVLRYLDRKDVRMRYHRLEKDRRNSGRIFIFFRWK
jgi:DNA-nicking Smr family endonuclease